MIKKIYIIGAFFLFLNLIDVALTYVGLTNGLHEYNPLLTTDNFFVMSFLKMLFMGITVFILARCAVCVRVVYDKYIEFVLGGFSLFYVGVVANNLYFVLRYV